MDMLVATVAFLAVLAALTLVAADSERGGWRRS